MSRRLTQREMQVLHLLCEGSLYKEIGQKQLIETPMKTKMQIALLGLTLLSAAPAAATIISYTTRASFDSAVGTTALIDFEAQNPGGTSGVAYFGSSLTVGDVTFTDNKARLYVLGQDVYTTQGSSYLNNNSEGTVVGINFATPVYAVGADWGYVVSWGDGSTAMFNLSTGDSFTLLLDELYSSRHPFSFYGFRSDVSISSITINDYSGGLAIDNFASSSVFQVPDVGSTALLLGVGIAGLASLSKIKLSRQRHLI